MKLKSLKPKYPTAEDVIEEIQRRQKAGLSLRSNEIQRSSRRDSTLYHTARRYFGQWYRAVEKAGFSHHEVSPCWNTYPTQQSVLAEIRRRHGAGLPLNYSAISLGVSRDTALVEKGCKVFGSWKKAIEAAGLDYDSIRKSRRKYRTAKKLRNEIIRRRKAGLPLNAKALFQGKNNRDASLYRSGIDFFGSWKKALKATGIRYKDVVVRDGGKRKYPTPEAVIAEIQRRQRAGLSIRSTALDDGPHPDVGLYKNARRYFGLWRRAVKRAGFSYWKKMYPRR